MPIACSRTTSMLPVDFDEEVTVFEDPTLQELWNQARSTDELYQEFTVAFKKQTQQLPSWIRKQKIVSLAECSVDEDGLLRFKGRLGIPASEPLRTDIIQEAVTHATRDNQDKTALTPYSRGGSSGQALQAW